MITGILFLISNFVWYFGIVTDPRIQTFRGDYDYFIPDNILFPEYMLKRIASLGNKVACVSFLI